MNKQSARFGITDLAKCRHSYGWKPEVVVAAYHTRMQNIRINHSIHRGIRKLRLNFLKDFELAHHYTNDK